VTPLDAAALVALLALPFHWAVKRELAQIEDPAYLRAHGVVIVSLSAIEAHSETIGRYRGQDIWRTLTFKGIVYAFDRVVPPAERERVGAGELYVEPGLVFRALHS
jgi:hypothetical protein